MASTKSVFDGGTRVSIYKFDPAVIKVHPELNGRHDLPDIEWLVSDIAANGQNTPVIIRKDGEDPVLVAGFSRWRAIIEINKRKLTPEPLPILCSYFKGNEVEGFLANIRENRFRNTTTDLDDSHNIVRLSEEAIAKIYFPDLDGDKARVKKAVAWVRKRAKLATLTPEAEKAVRDGRLKPSAAAHIAELASEAQRTILKSKSGSVTSKDIRQAQGKKLKLTAAQAKDEIDTVLSDGEVSGTAIPKPVLSWLKSLKDRM